MSQQQKLHFSPFSTILQIEHPSTPTSTFSYTSFFLCCICSCRDRVHFIGDLGHVEQLILDEVRAFNSDAEYSTGRTTTTSKRERPTRILWLLENKTDWRKLLLMIIQLYLENENLFSILRFVLYFHFIEIAIFLSFYVKRTCLFRH